MDRDILTIGIDSSTTNCGIALYHSGRFYASFNMTFGEKYTLLKLETIIQEFNILFHKHRPHIVVIEEPINVRNARAAMALSQVYGAIVALATLQRAYVHTIHNKTLKKMFEYKSKEEAIKIARKLTGKKDITEHEADAILLVEAYKEITNEMDES